MILKVEAVARPLQDEEGRALVHHLREGGLLAHPTETVYGLGCILRTQPLGRLARFKSREEGEAFLLLVPSDERWSGWRDLTWTEPARRLAGAFWPGPLTLVLRDETGAFPEQVRGGGGGVAVRRTSRSDVAGIVDRLGEPITSTSANRKGDPPATDPEALTRVLEGSEGPWALLDAGPLDASPPSTLVDCTTDHPRILRTGAVTKRELEKVVPKIDE